MRQPIKLNQTDVDAYADRATTLSEWLEEKTTAAASRITIPPELTIVAPLVVASGLFIFAGDSGPDAICWGGCVS